jgi:GDP-L-fucose synthase
MDISKKRILVTGGAGFLGHYVVDVLKARGCTEIFVPEHKQYDLCQREGVKEVLRISRPNIVIHMAAALGGIGAHVGTQARFLYENLIMGLEMMEQSKLSGVERYVTIGTSCSYPAGAPNPLREESLWDGFPDETTAPYGVAKRVMMLQGQYYRENYGLNAISVIPSNVYGPRDLAPAEKSHIIPAQIRKCLEAKKNGTPLVVWGTGKATRDFIYAIDCAEAIVRALEIYERSEPLNIGSGIQTSIREVVETIVTTLDFHGEVVWDVTKPEGNKGRALDMTRTQKEIGFKATTSLEDGMRATIDWYQGKL